MSNYLNINAQNYRVTFAALKANLQTDRQSAEAFIRTVSKTIPNLLQEYAPATSIAAAQNLASKAIKITPNRVDLRA